VHHGAEAERLAAVPRVGGDCALVRLQLQARAAAGGLWPRPDDHANLLLSHDCQPVRGLVGRYCCAVRLDTCWCGNNKEKLVQDLQLMMLICAPTPARCNDVVQHSLGAF
jgi:hypothetical protein